MERFVGCENGEEDGGCDAGIWLAMEPQKCKHHESSVVYWSHASSPPKKAVELTIPHPAVKLACSSTDDGGGGVHLRQAVGNKAEHYRYSSAYFVVCRCTGKVSEARVTGSESSHGYAAEVYGV